MSKRKRRQNRPKRYLPSAVTHKVPARVSRPRVPLDHGLAWFAVWTNPRCERRAEAGIEAAGFACYVPTEAHKVIRRGEAKPVERLPVGRYLFVGLTARDPEFGVVRNVDGVQAFVHAAGNPLRVPAGILQAYADALSSKVVDFRGGAFSRLLAVMSQADDVRARQRAMAMGEAA
jgi:transcription antitermination factor NusG